MPDLNTEILSAEQTDTQSTLTDLEQIDNLLKGEAPEPEKVDDAIQEVETPEAVPDKPEKADVDYSAEVPMADGSKVKLGELKDFYQNHATAKLDLVEQENQVMKLRSETEYLLSYVRDLPPEVRAAAEAQAVKDYSRESEMLQAAIPEVRTKEGAARVKESLYALAKDYDLPVSIVDGIRDHTTLKMMYDFARLKQSIKDAKANVKPLRAADAKAAQGSKHAPSDIDAKIARAKSSRNSSDQLQAIDALLRSA